MYSGGGIKIISISTSLPKQLNLYSLTKNQFGDLGRFFSEIGKLQFVNVLLESFYGTDEPDNRFIKKSIKMMVKGEKLEVTQGMQKRDYILVQDVVDILMFLATCNTFVENYVEIPVGSGVAPSIREILGFLHSQIHSASEIVYGAKPMRKNEPSTCADLSVLRALGYNKPLTYWQDGMKLMIREVLNENSD